MGGSHPHRMDDELDLVDSCDCDHFQQVASSIGPEVEHLVGVFVSFGDDDGVFNRVS